jgi:ribosome-binding protein aMBF1 (putative translation factor)
MTRNADAGHTIHREGEGMTNQELAEAIDQSHELLRKVAPNTEAYRKIASHLFCLLDVQLKRASREHEQ